MENIVFDDTINLMVGERIVNSLPFILAQKNCQRVIIVCDEPAFRLGYVDLVKHAFAYAPVDVEYIYKGIGDIATDKDVEEIVRKYRYFNCDGIIAVGKKAAIMASIQMFTYDSAGILHWHVPTAEIHHCCASI